MRIKPGDLVTWNAVEAGTCNAQQPMRVRRLEGYHTIIVSDGSGGEWRLVPEWITSINAQAFGLSRYQIAREVWDEYNYDKNTYESIDRFPGFVNWLDQQEEQDG